MLYKVQDGLWPVQFQGTQLAVSTTEVKMPEGRKWSYLSPWEKKSVSRWVEMELYSVEPGQADHDGRIQLPDGGYIYHVIGQSLVYHNMGSSCNAGVPARAGETEIDVLPCWKCRPEPPLLWEWRGAEADPDGDGALLLVPEGTLVNLESPRHTLQRSLTADEMVRKVIDRQLSTPAQRLLEIARSQDQRIAAVFSTPAA